MSETLIPAYYNTKINNHDWAIYMGGERYFPAYPALYVPPTPPEPPTPTVVKHWLLKDSSVHENYIYYTTNSYPVTFKEALVNENGETMEFDGKTYYIWTYICENKDGSTWENIKVLTNTLNVQLPFRTDDENPDFAYVIFYGDDGPKKAEDTYAHSVYEDFIISAIEYSDGSINYRMCNCETRLYGWHRYGSDDPYYSGGGPIDPETDKVDDYYLYNGEMKLYDGQLCYVWSRYDANTKVDENHYHYPEYAGQDILTNTLWIKNLPLTLDSPEVVAVLTYDWEGEGIVGSFDKEFADEPLNRIEYFPNVKCGDDIIWGTGQNIVKRYLVKDSSFHDYVDDWGGNYEGDIWEETNFTIWESDDWDYEDWLYYVDCNGACVYDSEEFINKWLRVGDKVIINNIEYTIDYTEPEYNKVHFSYVFNLSKPLEGYNIFVNKRSYLSVGKNSYPPSLLEAYINENDETMEFDGNTYYVWRGYEQYNDETFPETNNGNLIILTNSLDVSLPFNINSPEFAYIVDGFDGNIIDETDYLGYHYTFLSQVNEYNNGERRVKMANVGVRIYNYEHTNELFQVYPNLREDAPIDFYQYDGEIIEYDGQKCFVWNKYDSNELDGYNDKILTNTLWISSFPFTMNSPEFVAYLYDEEESNDDSYMSRDGEYNRIEYLPDVIYNPTPLDMTYGEIEIPVNINVKTILCDEIRVMSMMVYNGRTMEFNGKICYVWDCPNLEEGWRDSEGNVEVSVLTNTLDIQLPFSKNSPEYEGYIDRDDEYPHGRKSTMFERDIIERDYNIRFSPPIYSSEPKIVPIIK